MRRASRVDANQPEMVKDLRHIGMSVVSLAALGEHKPDLLVGWCGLNLMVEVKVPGWRKQLRPTGRAKVRFDGQQAFREAWQGVCIQAEHAREVLEWFRQETE